LVCSLAPGSRLRRTFLPLSCSFYNRAVLPELPVRDKLTLITISVNVTGLLYAIEPEAPPGLEAVPDVPPPPARVQSGETLEPEVTIVQRRDAKGRGISHQWSPVHGHGNTRDRKTLLLAGSGWRWPDGN
jgi:hypothetical protein